MDLWLVRGGKHGEQEATSLERSLACIEFYEFPDLAPANTKEKMRKLTENCLPSATKARIGALLGQLFQFAHCMKEGDIVAMPLKSQPQVALGRVAGPYEYRSDLGDIRHVRKVEWIRPDVPRSLFGQDLLNSLGALMTVCKIQKNNAAERVMRMLDGGRDPGFSHELPMPGDNGDLSADDYVDVEQTARDQIRSYVEKGFKSHDLARLVDAVLQAEGYVTHLSTPGPDGGVDILARRGSLGLDGSKLCVQVKSSLAAVDVVVLRALQGTMATFKADEGLLVSWGGFNQAVQKEARLSFFSVRLWDADNLLAAIQRNYERLPEELQAELPLKRIWALVPEE